MSRPAIQPGWTFYVCFGPWATPHFYRSSSSTRVVLGWLSIGWLFCDVECTIGNLSRRMIDAEQAVMILLEDAKHHGRV